MAIKCAGRAATMILPWAALLSALPSAANAASVGDPSSGAPLNLWATIVLGAIAGLTIFFGLPVAALKTLPTKALSLLNSTAIGVLFFLLYDILKKAAEPVEGALHAGQATGGWASFGGLLATFVIGFGIGLVGLVFVTQRLVARSQTGAVAGALGPMALASAIAIGIGLHNFSEGLAIGQSAATGAIQLAIMLIIGFGLHNMTEGFGIAAPLAGTNTATAGAIIRLGLIGGGPTFLGTVVGYRFVSPLLSVLFLTLAAGAIIYVIGEMLNAGRKLGFAHVATIGVFIGFLLGYGTDLILTYAGA